MSRPPPTYKTGRWSAYNKALRRRGSLTIWFDPATTWEPAPTGKRVRQPDHSDAAIQTCLTMKILFGMALRQTKGFVESLLRLMALNWAVPDFSMLSRRQMTLEIRAAEFTTSDVGDAPMLPELIGQRFGALDFDRQVAEFQVRVAVLNGVTTLGTPFTQLAKQARPGAGGARPSTDLCNRANPDPIHQIAGPNPCPRGGTASP